MSASLDSGRKANHLITEKSPYLLQHAHNPVDWYPWGEEAFEKAASKDTPVFLSIGYSTCHWCHVMERESFEDEALAALLNKDYVCIKVDREERPDIDSIYMSVCQAMTGHGGWPLTIIMTPDKKPFFAATYLPKHSRGGMTGLMDLLPRIRELWESKREVVLASCEKIVTWLQKEAGESGAGKLDEELFQRALEQCRDSFDSDYGGFGRAPKFPSPHKLYFLLRYYFVYGEPSALEMVEKTLESMYRGGIYDHIGFGFARYSTDSRWLVPHFEKMLYDNALLAIAYLEAYQLTRKDIYARLAREIFTYVLRDMTSPEGAFYSAEDADSEGVEGKFYLWTPEQIIEVLGRTEGAFFAEKYDISSRGNFEGENIPNLLKGIPSELDWERLEKSRGQLFAVREKRVHPFKDDKILCSWNGLMIAALAFAARVLDEPGYLQAARRAAAFILSKLRRTDGRLLASYREGEAVYPAYLDDYAYLIWAMIELYEASYDREFLQTALDLNNEMLRYFGDEDKGGLFIYGSDSEQLIARPKESYDGALPSGNSVAALNLLRLARLTGSTELEERAQKQLNCFADSINAMPGAYAFLLCAALYAAGPDQQIVIVGEAEEANSSLMLDSINKSYHPFTVSIFKQEGEADYNLPDFLKEMQRINGKSTAYICSHFTCQEPITSIHELNHCLQNK
ncbi:MAG: thioredoxin domain-containing protein [Syntrophomonadaceae bacterium]|nr:thioredoxin domain-containing protein [Syntrophomonadaceae bacterium]